ncbi:MAG: hypothetical protein WCT01_04810 [Candidatus Shapirobacteria bacterium]
MNDYCECKLDRPPNGPFYIRDLESSASLTYFKHNDGWLIDDIQSKKAGCGKKLVREMATRIGVDQPVYLTCVIEPNTRAALHHLGLLTKVEDSREALEFTDRNIIINLKMARVLTGGGVNVERVRIYPWADEARDDPMCNQDGCRVTVEMYGRTV